MNNRPFDIAPPPDKSGWPWTTTDVPLPNRQPDGSEWPRVTVVTPSYNQAQFLEETIRSVLLQGYPNLEYIIIDGGSSDGSAAIIRRYEPWLAYWVSEKDAGQTDAINKGLRRSTGEILCWLNSDDIFMPGALAVLVRQFLLHPEAGMIYGNIDFIDAHGNKVSERKWQPYSFELLATKQLMIPQQAALWRRHVMEKIGLPREDLHYSMDYEYWLRIGRHYPIVAINQVLARYRLWESSKSISQAVGFATDNLQIADEFYNSPDLPDHLRRLRSVAYSHVHQFAARRYLEARHIGRARQHLFQALLVHPPTFLTKLWWRILVNTVKT